MKGKQFVKVLTGVSETLMPEKQISGRKIRPLLKQMESFPALDDTVANELYVEFESELKAAFGEKADELGYRSRRLIIRQHCKRYRL
jgi:hypothetical protein